MTEILPLVIFALTTSITPGPNNMMLLASGANFGFRRTVPHMLGISLGHAFMVLVMGLGLAALITRFEQVLLALKALSVLYMLWLAWKIANAAAPRAAAEMGAGQGAPLTALQAAAFQWVNPKAVAMAITAVTLYGGAGGWAGAGLVAAVFAAVNLPSVSIWAALGQVLQHWLSSPLRLRVFNWTMAALLILSMLPVLWA